MKINKKTKKIIILLVCFIICLVIIDILITYNRNKKQIIGEHDGYKYIDMSTGQTLAEEVIIPKDSLKFFEKYYGEVLGKDIYERIYEFSKNLLPEYLEEIKTKSSQDFYNQNTERIKRELGIEKFDDFQAFYERLNGKDLNTTKLTNISFIKEKIQTINQGTYASIEIEYNEKDTIEINMFVYNKEDNGKMIIFY